MKKINQQFDRILDGTGQKGYRPKQEDEKIAPLIKHELVALIEESQFYIDLNKDKLAVNRLKQQLWRAKSVGAECW